MSKREGAEREPKHRDREMEHGHDDKLVDEASLESFPASDPPPFSHSHAGTPSKDSDQPGPAKGR